jgi:hypothetical protein
MGGTQHTNVVSEKIVQRVKGLFALSISNPSMTRESSTVSSRTSSPTTASSGNTCAPRKS